MPATPQWDTPEQNRLVLELIAPITWDEFHNGVKEAHRMITGVQNPVDLVIWAKARLPAGFALPQFRSSFQNQPPNTARIIIVPEEKPFMLMFFRQLGSVIQKTMPKKSGIVFVNTIDEARQLSLLSKA